MFSLFYLSLLLKSFLYKMNSKSTKAVLQELECADEISNTPTCSFKLTQNADFQSGVGFSVQNTGQYSAEQDGKYPVSEQLDEYIAIGNEAVRSHLRVRQENMFEEVEENLISRDEYPMNRLQVREENSLQYSVQSPIALESPSYESINKSPSEKNLESYFRTPQGYFRKRQMLARGIPNPVLYGHFRPPYPPVSQEKVSLNIAHQTCDYLRRVRLRTPAKKMSQLRLSPNYHNFRSGSQSCISNFRPSQENDLDKTWSSSELEHSFENCSQDSSSLDRYSEDNTTDPLKESSPQNSSLRSIDSDDLDVSSDSSFQTDENVTPTKEILTVEVAPLLERYQLVGDSLLLRFAEQLLHQEAQVVHGLRRIGLCVSGQKMADLLRKLKFGNYLVAEKIVLLIGTNDILQNTCKILMCKLMKCLLKRLRRQATRIVLLTLPPIPKLQLRSEHWEKIDSFNAFMKSQKDDNVTVADISPLFTTERKACRMEFFEKYYGDGGRVDLIHLNKLGLEQIHNFLTSQNYLI